MVEAIVASLDKYIAGKKPDDPPRVTFGDYGNGVIKYGNQPVASEMVREPVKTMLEFLLPACVAAKRTVVITAGFKRAAYKHAKSKLSPSSEWDNGSFGLVVCRVDRPGHTASSAFAYAKEDLRAGCQEVGGVW